MQDNNMVEVTVDLTQEDVAVALDQYARQILHSKGIDPEKYVYFCANGKIASTEPYDSHSTSIRFRYNTNLNR